MRIGFVDHHLNNYHANKFLSLIHGELAEQGARVIGAWESHPTGEDWCAKNNIPRLASARAVADAADAVIVLAPDNIDAHPALCAEVFPAGKPCMVDKYLAPTRAEAAGIVDLAARHNVPIFSASSLRFAVELEAAKKSAPEPATEAFATGFGVWPGYGVHTLSLVFGVLGGEVKRLINTGRPGAEAITLDYGDQRRGHVSVRAAENQGEAIPWSFGFLSANKYHVGTIKDFNGFYANLIRRSLAFFKSRESPICTREMLAVCSVLELGARRDEWISL